MKRCPVNGTTCELDCTGFVETMTTHRIDLLGIPFVPLRGIFQKLIDTVVGVEPVAGICPLTGDRLSYHSDM
jgi:hypothetical protein